MAAFSGNDPPPISQIVFDSNFSIHEIAQKVDIFAKTRLALGKKRNNFGNKSILHGREIFLTKKVPIFNGKMVKMVKSGQNMERPRVPKRAKNDLKMPKNALQIC